MGETRLCEHCGTAFEPRREHSRFCSPGCRISWVTERSGGPGGAAAAGPGQFSTDNALAWSVAAMTEATARLADASALDLPRMAAAVSEAVWWVTIVDATMVRYELDAYDGVLDGLPAAECQRIEATLAGLRYVRNQVGLRLDPAGFVAPAPDGGWVWNPLPEPCLEALSERGRDWEMARYRAYQSRLAGHDVAGTFALASDFLTRTAWTGPSASAAPS